MRAALEWGTLSARVFVAVCTIFTTAGFHRFRARAFTVFPCVCSIGICIDSMVHHPRICTCVCVYTYACAVSLRSIIQRDGEREGGGQWPSLSLPLFTGRDRHTEREREREKKGKTKRRQCHFRDAPRVLHSIFHPCYTYARARATCMNVYIRPYTG